MIDVLLSAFVLFIAMCGLILLLYITVMDEVASCVDQNVALVCVLCTRHAHGMHRVVCAGTNTQ